jgi:hypothetical protein
MSHDDMKQSGSGQEDVELKDSHESSYDGACGRANSRISAEDKLGNS